MEPKERIPATLRVEQTTEGFWQLRAIDEEFQIELTRDLPATFGTESKAKREYWLQKTIVVLAKDMSKLVSERIRKNGTKQRFESDQHNPKILRRPRLACAKKGP